MFTGLIQEVGTLLSLVRHGLEAEIKISTSLENFEVGESIAIMGACLSVTSFGPGYFSAFTSYETLKKTGLKDLHSGAKVNIERALKMGDAMGGHLVTGMWTRGFGLCLEPDSERQSVLPSHCPNLQLTPR